MIYIKGRQFVPFIDESQIHRRVEELAKQIAEDYAGKFPIMLAVLNGSFMFLSDLVKKIDLPLEISFVKVSSYHSMSSSGEVKGLIGLTEELQSREVIIVEDIIDTGLSMEYLLEIVQKKQPKNITIVSLLLKPNSLKRDISVDYLGFEIPNKFVVGYGLDFEGIGRNLNHLYQIRD